MKKHWLKIIPLSCLILFGSCKLEDNLDSSLVLQEEIASLQAQLLDSVTETNSLMNILTDLNEQINNGIIKTEEAIRLQMVGVALEQMFKPSNIEQLEPPTRMMPYAKIIAREATNFEITELSHLLISDAKYGSGPWKSRGASLVAAACIAGFASMTKIKEIIAEQIDQGGVYEESTYGLIMGRYMFIRDALFKPIIEKSAILNKSILMQSVSYFLSLKHIAGLEYTDQLALWIPPLVKEQLDPNEVNDLGRQARSLFEQELDDATLSEPEVQQLLDVFDASY